MLFVGAEADSRFGWAVRGLNDFNGDFIGDFAVGAPFAEGENGRFYVA